MKQRLSLPPVLKRWLMFNSVGAMGILVQMGVLVGLVSGIGFNYLAATGLAVEAAVLHNFFWHERWTWADRTRNRRKGLLRRFLGFHVTNGALSLAGNIVLMRLFVERLDMHYLPANALAIALCSILTFMAGDRIIFRAAAINPKTGGMEMNDRYRRGGWPSILLLAALLSGPTAAKAAELQPETVKAWLACVEATEQRVVSELASSKGFLAMDFQDKSEALRERRAVLSGEILIVQIANKDKTGRPIDIPDGEVHHWRGAVYIPGVTLDDVLDPLENPSPENAKQEDVLDYRVLEKSPGKHRLYLKLQRSKIVTVRYNTEHLIQYRRYSGDRASSSSVATRIAEIENLGDHKEQEKPEGRDRGFLWRMNSYWRYEQVSGGVLVECESMTLSRSVPPIVQYMARPLIKGVARESMQRTLQSLRTRMVERATAPDAAQAFVRTSAR
jgi:putative flippase GtrA